MSRGIPTHLQGHVELIEEKGVTRKLRVVSDEGGTRFRLRFAGELLPKFGLITGTNDPLLVIAVPEDDGDEFVLFDGARHGYEAMFVDEGPAAPADRPARETYRDGTGEELFELTVTLFDNVDWDEEQADVEDEQGVIRLVDGTVIDAERLRADGFDAFALTGRSADDRELDIVEEELA